MKTDSMSPPTLPAIRHDGWTGDKMALFLETLADTAVVAEACDEARVSRAGAYKLRRRNAYFAIAWDAALGLARERLADTLLARSMEGNVEQIWRGGEIVGERHVLDNRLGLAILRRLDRLAETGLAVHNLSPSSVRPRVGELLPCAPPAIDWDQALDALRSRDPDAIATALAVVQGNEVDEVDDPPIRDGEGDTEEDGIDLSDRIWRDENNDMWLTDFPPPPGFDGYRQEAYGDDDYERQCTPEEVAAVEACNAADAAEALAEDEAERDAWFALLRDQAFDPGNAASAPDVDDREEEDAMDDDKKPMPADGAGTQMNAPDDIGETASRRDADMPGGLPNTGESGGGPYPNPYSDADRKGEKTDRFEGGQSVAGYFGKGQLGDKKLAETHNAPSKED